jgi:dihydrofolate reductase
MTVFLLAAITVDGFIGRNSSDRSFDWTSAEDKQFYIDSIKRARAVVMGRKSFETFTRYPKGLKYVLYTSHPETFVNPKPEVITAEATKDDPKMVLERLEAEGYSEVAICGGASIYTQFMKAGLIDKLYLTVEPVVFGQGVGLFSEAIEAKLRLVELKHLSDQTLLLEYDVERS